MLIRMSAAFAVAIIQVVLTAQELQMVQLLILGVIVHVALLDQSTMSAAFAVVMVVLAILDTISRSSKQLIL